MEIVNILKHALIITFFVFVMMLLVDFINIITKRRVSDIMKGGRWRQYTQLNGTWYPVSGIDFIAFF